MTVTGTDGRRYWLWVMSRPHLASLYVTLAVTAATAIASFATVKATSADTRELLLDVRTELRVQRDRVDRAERDIAYLRGVQRDAHQGRP